MSKAKQKSKKVTKKKQRKLQDLFLYGVIGLVILSMVGVGILSISTPANSSSLMGEEVSILNASHVPTDSAPGPYSSNPPAGGPHFEPDFDAGFFEESDLATLPQYPEGYLVHSMEHGYVIFWYNCAVGNTDCSVLKQIIRDVMGTAGRTKLIAFPWSDMDVPLAMTSWGRILKFSEPDAEQMTQFVLRNRNQAPEPNMP